jgi:hypothetical protein
VRWEDGASSAARASVAPRPHPLSLRRAGTTSQALIKEQPWLQKHLSTIASGIAIVVGLLMLAAGMGFEVPFFS